MAFDIPAPDLNKLIAAWDEWETGAETPGKVLSKLKTAGLPAVLAQLRDSSLRFLFATTRWHKLQTPGERAFGPLTG